MNNLKIIGTQVLNNIKMKIIEGGFGENQKCILASDIAMQHGYQTKYINQCINRELKRFNENDLVDLKTGCSEQPRKILELTKTQWGNSKNIFLLSERGYTKLVAMMDNNNEKKWEVMDKLIDGYFHMREKIKEIKNKEYSQEDIMMYQLQEQKKMKERLNKVESNIEDIKIVNDSALVLGGSLNGEWKKSIKAAFWNVACKYEDREMMIRDLYERAYSTLEKEMHVNLEVRLNNRIKRAIGIGTSKTKANKFNRLDVINDDVKLIAGFKVIASRIVRAELINMKS